MSPADAAKLQALQDLEYDISDMTCMADIATEATSDAFACLHTHRELAGGKPNLYHLTEDQLNRILFSTRHAWQMAKALENKFLAILEGPREAGEEVQR